MSLYFGYDDKLQTVEEKVEVEGNYLSGSGGKMKGDINMSLNRLKNIRRQLILLILLIKGFLLIL